MIQITLLNVVVMNVLNQCRVETVHKGDKDFRSIYCDEIRDIDLKAIFHNFSKQLSNNEKHFHRFEMKYSYIEILEENTFR